jgi:hypothetical protein
MTVRQLLAQLAVMPPDAMVLMQDGAGLSLVSALEFVAGTGPGAPDEVVLLPNMDE